MRPSRSLHGNSSPVRISSRTRARKSWISAKRGSALSGGVASSTGKASRLAAVSTARGSATCTRGAGGGIAAAGRGRGGAAGGPEAAGPARRAPPRPSRYPRVSRERYRARRRSCGPSGHPDHVLDHLGDDLFPDLLHALPVADEQGDVAQVVDLARRPTREIEDELDRFLGEELVRLAGHLEPVADVARGVRVVERVQVRAQADPLVEVLEAADLRAELGRADEQERQQELVVGLEVHQEPELLEDRVVLDELGLVDDDDAVTPGLVVVEEQIVEQMQELRLARLLRLDSQLVEDFSQEVDRGPARVGEKPDLVALGLEPLDEGARQGGLAAAVLAREHPAALAVAHHVDETDERLLVLGRQIEKLRVRRVVEGRLGELPVRFVHGQLLLAWPLKMK